MSAARIRLGTSSWTAEGWVGSFYPAGSKPAEFLPIYAERFDTVEIDSTFYRIPAARTVELQEFKRNPQSSRTTPRYLLPAMIPAWGRTAALRGRAIGESPLREKRLRFKIQKLWLAALGRGLALLRCGKMQGRG